MNCIINTSISRASNDCIFAPLSRLVGDGYASQYMYVCTHETITLRQKVFIHEFKHEATRKPIYICASGKFYEYTTPERKTFRPLLFQHGFSQMIGNAIATYAQDQAMNTVKIYAGIE